MSRRKRETVANRVILVMVSTEGGDEIGTGYLHISKVIDYVQAGDQWLEGLTDFPAVLSSHEVHHQPPAWVLGHVGDPLTFTDQHGEGSVPGFISESTTGKVAFSGNVPFIFGRG